MQELRMLPVDRGQPPEIMEELSIVKALGDWPRRFRARGAVCRCRGRKLSRREVLLRAEPGLWLGPRDDSARRGRRVWTVRLLPPSTCKNYTVKPGKCECESHQCEFPAFLIELLEHRLGVRTSWDSIRWNVKRQVESQVGRKSAPVLPLFLYS